MVAKLNRTMMGWANYFCLDQSATAYRAVESHACKRLRQWLCAKHKVMSGTERFSAASLHDMLGLVRLPAAAQSPVGDRVTFLREPDAGNPHVRFDERGVKTEAWSGY